MDDSEYLTVQQLSEQLGCLPDEALSLVRRVGPRGVIRTADRRFLIPRTVVEQLRSSPATAARLASPPTP